MANNVDQVQMPHSAASDLGCADCSDLSVQIFRVIMVVFLCFSCLFENISCRYSSKYKTCFDIK